MKKKCVISAVYDERTTADKIMIAMMKADKGIRGVELVKDEEVGH